MDLIQQLKRGARLSEFVRMRAFFNSRVFRVGSKADAGRESGSGTGSGVVFGTGFGPEAAAQDDAFEGMRELHDFVARKIILPFKDDSYYERNKEKFDGIFRTRNRNLISVAEMLERRNPRLKGALDPSVLTRGFVKGIEMYQFIARRGFLRRNTGDSLKAFHMSELPGGFFLAFRHFCHLYDVTPVNALHSLKYDQNKYPHAFRDIFNLQKLDAIDYGVSHGDLTKRREVEYFKRRYANLDLVTGDFGYNLGDESPNSAYVKIFEHELEIAKTILHPRGVLVLKVYLLLNEQNLRMIYSVYREFGDLHFYKPLFSRFHSFEIYLIARRSNAPRLEYAAFLENILPFMRRVVMKIYSMYSLFVYMHSYGQVTKEDAKAIRHLKHNLSEEIAQQFTAHPSVRL